MSPDAPSRGPAADSPPTASTRRPARTFPIMLLLVGLGGYVVAAADSSVAKTSVADGNALGQQDPVVAAKALRSLGAPIRGAYDTYAACESGRGLSPR